MKKSTWWTRREFVKRVGLASAATVASGPLLAVSATHLSSPSFAYVGSAEGHIAVFAAGAGRWKQLQQIATPQPSVLVLHPNKDVLYAVNEIDLFDHLPSGSVEAYSIQKDGRIALLNRQPLSLSATAPRHAAISPDGRALVVAIHGGGAYNVLPIREDGSLARVSAILKETGFGPDENHLRTSHPQMVLFDNKGRLLSADQGCDRLNIFCLEQDHFSVLMRRETQAGSGPRQIALHPNSELLFVANAQEPSIHTYRYDSHNGQILEPLHSVLCNSAEGRAMTMHPSGDFLYTASNYSGAVTTWRIDTTTGTLHRIHEAQAEDNIHTLMITPHDNNLLTLSQSAVTRWQINMQGQPTNPLQAAVIRQPISIAVKQI